jgi:hypothetical protein
VLLGEWNETLMAWFFSRRPHERAYLRVDDAELERINDERALGLHDAAKDLISAVQDEVHGVSSLRWLRRQGDEWRSRADPDEVPPWLGLITVSVLVVARESERGSLAFYRPLSNMLGLSSMLTQDDYEESFYKWWVDLARWLAESNAGKRGLPSWRRIPHTGPRCVVGHPYTQVLLRRDDLRDVDAFLLSLGHLGPGDLEITDAATAGADLLERLRRWATQRKVSGRLWELLHGSHRDAGDSLQYMLLDRLLDEVDIGGARVLKREASLVVTLDDWIERRLQFAAIAPASAELWESRTIDVDGQMVGPLEDGEPHITPIPVDSGALDDGVSVTAMNDIALVYRPSDIVVLAARDWSLWCSVEDAEVGETVYLLVADRATSGVRHLLESFRPASIQGVPTGWTLYGPGALTLPRGQPIVGLPMRKSWQAVPRLVGGLEVARSTFLVGGPPGVFVPADSAEMTLRVDGESLGAAVGEGSIMDLRELELGSGHHRVDVGPYRLTFELRAFGRLPDVAQSVGRTTLGVIVPIDRAEGQPVFAGAARLPDSDYDPVVISPLGARLIVLGLPGQAVECSTMMGPWATAAGLPQLVFEPTQNCSYPDGRPLSPLLWVATVEGTTGSWSVTQVQRAALPAQAGAAVAPGALEVVTAIGFEAVILRDGLPEDSVVVAEEWAGYARSVIGAI